MGDWMIRGGTVVTPAGAGPCDVLIQGERVAAVMAAGQPAPSGFREFDAVGCVVLPGGVDPHVHTLWPQKGPGGGLALSAPAPEISRAALYGGTTTMIDFALAVPGRSLEAVVEEKSGQWADAYCDYSLHIILQGRVPPETIAQMPEVIEAGYTRASSSSCPTSGRNIVA